MRISSAFSASQWSSAALGMPGRRWRSTSSNLNGRRRPARPSRYGLEPVQERRQADRRSRRSSFAAGKGHPAPSGSSAACTPRATASSATTTRRSSCSARSPTPTPTTVRPSRTARRSSPTPSSRSARTTGRASRTPRSSPTSGARARSSPTPPPIFGDADAQLNLARMYYEGEGGERDPLQAARWAKLAADKGNVGAQALLGHLLFEGEGVERQPVLGLMYLTVARDRARPTRWISGCRNRRFRWRPRRTAHGDRARRRLAGETAGQEEEIAAARLPSAAGEVEASRIRDSRRDLGRNRTHVGDDRSRRHRSDGRPFSPVAPARAD